MGASTNEQILEMIAHDLEFYKAASAKKCNSTSEFALCEVQETNNSANFHLTGTSKLPSSQTENHKYLLGQNQRELLFSDKDPVFKKWISQDDEESDPRPHHGQDFSEAGKSVAELECSETSTFQSNQLQQAHCEQSLRDRRANLPALQPEATNSQSPNNVEVVSSWPELKSKNLEEDDMLPGMDESHAFSDGSCETEDSCDYSSGTEDHKAAFTPLSKSFLQEAANPLENKSEDKVAKMKNGPSSSCLQRLKALIDKKISQNQRTGKQISNQSSIITIESDSEDELVLSSKTATSSGLDCDDDDPKSVIQRKQNYLKDIIIIDSDTEDDGNLIEKSPATERASCSVDEDKGIHVIPNQQCQRENKMEKNILISADLLKSRSQCQNKPEDNPEDKLEGAFYDLSHGTQLMESQDYDSVENAVTSLKEFESTKNVNSRSDSGEDSKQSTLSSTKHGENREIYLQSKKLKPLPKDLAKTLPREVPQPTDFSRTGLKKTDTNEKDQLCFSQKKGGHLSKLKLRHSPKLSIDPNVAKQGTHLKHLSPTTKRDLPISTCRSILSRRKTCEAGQSSSSDGFLHSEEPTSPDCKRKKLKRVTFAPRPDSPFKRPARSASTPSTSDTSAFCNKIFSPTCFSPCAEIKSSPRKKVLEDWTKAHHPIRIGRKYYQGAEQNVETANRTPETTNHTSTMDSDEPDGPEPAQHIEVPRQRRRSQDSNTSLMKRCKNEAMVWSKAIHRRPAQTKRSTIGVGYKWSERPPAASQQKVLA